MPMMCMKDQKKGIVDLTTHVEVYLSKPSSDSHKGIGTSEDLHFVCYAGVSVMGLGALNKAEFINRGGGDILLAFEPRRTR